MVGKSRKGISVILLDILSISIAYFMASFHCFQDFSTVLNDKNYRYGMIISLLVYLCVAIIAEYHTNFYNRGYVSELFDVIKLNFCGSSCVMILMFLSRITTYFSRKFWGFDLLCCNVCMFVVRCIYKSMVQRYYRNKKHTKKLMLVSTKGRYRADYEKILLQLPMEYEVIGMCVLDEDMEGQYYKNTPIVSNEEDLYDFLRLAAVDEVFVSAPGYPVELLESIILTLEHMGITVSLSIKTFGLFPKEKMVNNFGGFNVLTYSTKLFQRSSLILKRFFDILGALLGLAITGVISIVIIPLIKIESPGPAIFTQVRIGQNGRRFRMYKFRSMYIDAEERKKELMAQNEMQGLMFKMKDDPRITKIGHFIRKTSIDELPQFFNVLKGDMSLVGTRPPTVDEFEQYSTEHKRRLSIKPGITGLWQVSGRSDITNFDEVVKLDLEYIDNWTIFSDFRIVAKTFKVVVAGSGSR